MHRVFSLCAVTLSLLVASASVSAQTPRPERPYRGLFASGTDNAGQLLKVSGSLASGYDSNLLADAIGRTGGSGGGGTGSRVAGSSGMLAHMSGSLAYSLQSDGLSIAASAATSARFYPSSKQQSVRSSQGHAEIEALLREGTSLSASASVMHQPFTLSPLFANAIEPSMGGVPLPDMDLATSLDSYVLYEGDALLSHRLSRRVSLSATYTFRTAADRRRQGEFVYQRAGGHLTYQIGRGLNAHAGYGYGEAQYPGGRRVPHHIIDAGADYHRALSISRRTTLSFGTGSSAANATTSTASDPQERLRFAIIGNAALNHEIGRTWNASVAYSRRMQFHETFDQPLLVDAASFAFGGLITRRLEFTSTAYAAIGTVGLAAGSPRFSSYHGSAALTYTFTRFVNAGVTYSFYSHDIDEGVVLPLGSTSQFDRQGVRASVNLWAPLFQRGRRTDATR